MKAIRTYKPIITSDCREEDLLKGLFLVVLHANRIPPHIGLIIDQHYHSLTIKGHDNTSVSALFRNINQRAIPGLFFKIKPHTTFSEYYLREHFLTNMQQFLKVDVDQASCISPIRLFFEEVFNLDISKVNFLYELLPALESKGLIERTSSLFLDAEKYQLPFYTDKEIRAGIIHAREEASRMLQ